MWFLISLISSLTAGTVDHININRKAKAALPEQRRCIAEYDAIRREHEKRLEEMREAWRKQDEIWGKTGGK